MPVIELDLSHKGIYQLEGIEKFRNLEILNLRGNNVTDLSPLQGLMKLKVLDLGYNRIIDLEKANFHLLNSLQLIELNLDHNIIERSETEKVRLIDIHLLKHQPSLKRLSLEDNHIYDLKPLADLTQLEDLNLRENNLKNLNGLEQVTSLISVNLRQNQLTDITAIKNLNKLKYLNLHSNEDLVDVSALAGLVNLEELIMRDVPIGDQIYVLENMTKLQRLNIRNCSVTDISGLIHLMEAGALQDNEDEEIFAYLDILENDIPEDPFVLSGFRPFWDNISVTYPAFINDSILPPPNISHEGGFYQAGFYKSMGSELEDVQIHFTMDGSVPTKESAVYDQPLWIESQIITGDANLTATTIRARVIETKGYHTSPIITHTYFVGDNYSDIFSLPVVSLVTTPDFFFDSETGIYYNYLERGEKWEKPIHMAFYETDQRLAFEQEIQVRIHGSSSRLLPQKSLRIYSETYTGEEQLINYEIFPGYMARSTGEPLRSFRTLLLRNSGNQTIYLRGIGNEYSYTFFTDAFFHQLVSHTNLDIQSYRPVNVFINGIYWGIYNIRERLDEFYLEGHYQVNPDDVVIYAITPEINFYDQTPETNEFLTLREYILTHAMDNDENYEIVKKQIDIDNFIDNQIVYIYAANGDWIRNNVIFWKLNVKDYNQNASIWHDGRWRWMVVDMDFGFRLVEVNLLSVAIGDSPGALLMNSLIKNENFRLQFINRFADHLNTTFNPEHVVSMIDSFEALYEPDMGLHLRRWNKLENSIDQWHKNVDGLRDFANARPEFQRQHIIEAFDLSGIYALSVHTNQIGGYVKVNTIDILDDTPGVDDASSWTGVYFNDVPITLRAIPFSGYEFSHWEGLGNEHISDDALSLAPNTNLQITAIFNKIK